MTAREVERGAALREAAGDAMQGRAQSTPYRSFGDFRFDVRAGELEREGNRVRLTPKDAQLLEFLTRTPLELVGRRRIRKAVWPGAIVEFDSALNSAIKRLRGALGDDARDPNYIETLPGRGYRFMQPVTTEPSLAVSSRRTSLLVLPVTLMGQTRPEMEEALTGELLAQLLTRLGGSGSVRVMSASGPQQIVDAVRAHEDRVLLLRSSLLVAADAGRLSMRMTAMESCTVLWAASIGVSGSTVLALAEELCPQAAERITEALGALVPTG